MALVGCGKVADDHLSEIRKLSNARVVAVCDLEPLMAEQVAVRYGVPAYYSDVDQMLEVEKADVVHITTPPQSHLPLAIKAVDAGCHLYVEKPLAMNYPDAVKLIDYATSRNRKLTIGYTYFFDPAAVRMRQLVQQGILGELVHIESLLGYDLAGPFGVPVLIDSNHWLHRLSGKLFHNVADHLLNKIMEFMPEERPTVAAKAWQYSESDDAGFPDELRVLLTAKRVSAYATVSSAARPIGHSLTIYGTKNTARLDLVGQTVTLLSSPFMPGAIGRLSPAFNQSWKFFKEGIGNTSRFARSKYHYFEGLNFLLSSFYESIIHDSAVPIPYSLILSVSSVMDDVFSQLNVMEQQPA